MAGNVLEIEDLRVDIPSARGVVRAVRGTTLSIAEGEVLGLVGESGCGKSMTAMSIAGLLPEAARLSFRRLAIGGKDMAGADTDRWREVRRNMVGVVFQNPMKALNPRLIVADQLREALLPSEKATLRGFYRRAVELLESVGIDRAPERLQQYPHELSGGLAQRVVIALALARHPKLLIADEPTTALDVSVQAQILDLIDRLRMELGLGVLLVSHDLDVIRDRANRVAVMYAGRIIERGRTMALIDGPRHPYSAALIAAVPNVARPKSVPLVGLEGAPPSLIAPPSGCAFFARCPMRTEHCSTAEPALAAAEGDETHLYACWNSKGQRVSLLAPKSVAAQDAAAEAASAPVIAAVAVSKSFGGAGLRLFWGSRTSRPAVKEVSVAVQDGESLGIVGESGSGKTTLARMLVGLEKPVSGTVLFDGHPVDGLDAARRRAWRRDVQFVFQDSSSSLDPRYAIGDSIAEPLGARGASREERRATVAKLLREVGLEESFYERKPHQLSGGQRQRVGIARALASSPRLIIADEPVSSLDVSVQATILNLLNRLRAERRMSYIVISHDLGVINYICTRVAVVYRGEIVETGEVDTVLRNPQHDYTKRLLEGVPGGRKLVRGSNLQVVPGGRGAFTSLGSLGEMNAYRA